MADLTAHRFSDGRLFGDIWQDHGWPLLFFSVLSVLLTWPLLPNFNSTLIGQGDARHHLWILWHTKEALNGAAPLFRATSLYYPYGTTLWTSALGPLLGLVALPFWMLGPAAAYNGVLLFSFVLTGYSMYRLARGLNFSSGVAFFAGVVLLLAPLRLAAVYGHLNKVFLALLPWLLLATCRSLNLRRSPWWAGAVGGIMLLALLHSGEQYVYGGLAVALFVGLAILAADATERGPLLKRAGLMVSATLMLTGPFLWSITRVMADPLIPVDRNYQSVSYQPDLAAFFWPGNLQRLTWPWLSHLAPPGPPPTMETAVFMAWTGLLLCLLALWQVRRAAGPWLMLTGLSVLLALGPSLVIFGQHTFTEYNLPIILPYAFLTALPGLDFMRTPGRFMLIGYVGFGISAAYGLAWLHQRLATPWKRLVVPLAVGLVLLETWPPVWPQEKFRPVPPFYQMIAHDPAQYGVFDLPLRPAQSPGYENRYTVYSSYYQLYQMTHKKGIAAGYIDRPYRYHPLFGHIIGDEIDNIVQETIRLDGEPASRYANLRADLADYGYRYVVYHKPQAGDPLYQAGGWATQQAEQFIAAAFGQQTPLLDDSLTTVYEVGPPVDPAELQPTIALLGSDAYHWKEVTRANPQAGLYLVSPRLQPAYLLVTAFEFYDPRSQVFTDTGRLTLRQADGLSSAALLTTTQTVALPLFLHPGRQTAGLALQVSDGAAPLGFSLQAVDLRLPLADGPSPDLFVNGAPPAAGPDGLVLLPGPGWYLAEAPTWRWAASPASLFVYSPLGQPVHLALTPVFLNDPARPGQTAAAGQIRLQLNDGPAQSLPAQIERPLTVDLTLLAGWNTISMSLDAGNFQPGGGDRRELSFATSRIEINNVETK